MRGERWQYKPAPPLPPPKPNGLDYGLDYALGSAGAWSIPLVFDAGEFTMQLTDAELLVCWLALGLALILFLKHIAYKG